MRTRRTGILLSCIWLAALVQFPLTYIYTVHTSKKCDREKCCLLYELEKCVLPPLVIWLLINLQLAAICVVTILNYKIFKIVRDQRQRMASELVLQPQQSEQIQSEQVQSEKNMTWLRHLAKELKAMKTFSLES